MKSSSKLISLRIEPLEFWKLKLVVILVLVPFRGLRRLPESQSSVISCSWLRSIRLWVFIGVGTHIDVLREELEGDCVIRRTGDFWTCCCWLSLVSIGIEGVVERTGSAGDLIGRSIGDGLLCGCWTKELEDSFLLKPFVLTSLFRR